MIDEPDGQEGVGGGIQGAPEPSNVTVLRMPGATPPEAYSHAVERLMEAMILSATISRAAADSYVMLLKVASVSAPYGQHGGPVSKIIDSLSKRLAAHLATLPDNRPPGAA